MKLKIYLLISHIFFLSIISFLILKDIPKKQISIDNNLICNYESDKKIGDFNGQDLFDAVNCYRQKQGLKPLIMNQDLCNNLLQRYFDTINPDNKYIAHAGFESWVKNNPAKNGFTNVSENMFINASSLSNVINGWDKSPGHHEVLVSTDKPYACTYAIYGYAFLEIGKK